MFIGRRDFLRCSAAAAVAVALPKPPEPVETRNGMPYRVLGRTGEKVSLLGVGGAHIGRGSREDAVRIIRTAIDEGVNFLDNAWAYHDGRSEEYMGAALKDGYREKAFLMTKTRARDRETARVQLEESLRRLDLDVIDLWQFHECNHPEEPERIYGEGAIEFALDARDRGLIRYIGFTGHNLPSVHEAMIDRGFEWDSVQMPLNIFDAHYRSFQKAVIPKALEKNIGVIAMKTCGGGGLLQSGVVNVAECLRYAMNLPVATVVSGMDSMDTLRQNLATAKEFEPLTDDEKQELIERTRTAAAEGRHESYKYKSA